MPSKSRVPRRSAVSHRRPGEHRLPVHPRPLPTHELITPYFPPQPTAHAICRKCGRIVRVEIPPDELPTLQAFVNRRPDGWNVEGMSFSFTGLCPSCRTGASR